MSFSLSREQLLAATPPPCNVAMVDAVLARFDAVDGVATVPSWTSAETEKLVRLSRLAALWLAKTGLVPQLDAESIAEAMRR